MTHNEASQIKEACVNLGIGCEIKPVTIPNLVRNDRGEQVERGPGVKDTHVIIDGKTFKYQTSAIIYLDLKFGR